MKYATSSFVLTVVLFGSVFLVSSRPVAASASPSFSAFSSETTATPAALIVVTQALHVRSLALVAGRRYRRAARCFGYSPRLHLGKRPPRQASFVFWQDAKCGWQSQLVTYRTKFAKLWHRMNYPGGSGWERWRPLVRWVWPARLVNTVIQIMHYESGGAEHRWNLAGSGAFGFLQLLPKPAGVWTAFQQLTYAYWHKYVAAGCSWSPWAGCRAFAYCSYW